ncbi:PE domain-containing protein [Nocardia sp. SYP-A9097]|uniref:PE domain-containing protein n=1 Tax=Nocardia sp. SYP-A9097 TaxID=2663237 RepID=UPI00129BB435|nr:PE domain-containing protein [Nocardia sp. SYP-A9097]MRH89371.1 PE domain-containing protein [Nocardia sp. SYP-A9097]
MSRIAFDHELARQAAGRLDALADGLESGLRDSSAALSPAAAALDPVSRRTSQSIEEVGVSFRQSYLGGAVELRKIAANLRSHADLHEGADGDAVAAFQPLM